MQNWKIFITFVSLLTLILGNFYTATAQQPLAQQAYAIFEQSCLNCHGEHGQFTEAIVIDHTALLDTGAVVPGQPNASELYRRLLEKNPAKRMPLGQPQLPASAIRTIGNWIQAGAPDWETPAAAGDAFITHKKMLETIEKHINALAPRHRPFARYFATTHLYNAGETTEALHAYQRALSKLVNSLSWGREIVRPEPIDPEETIFYIDLRDYEWEQKTNRPNLWTLIEQKYPYKARFNVLTQTALGERLSKVREALDCEVPFVDVDWFLATASLPPLYHDILGLPATDRELEAELDIDVVSNLRNAAGKRVWRAGFTDSGVSNHNRVVERHTSRYGAYWKSYDFAGSAETQNIFTHPLSFEHDGGEIIFNLPNGLQAYYLADAAGRRLDSAPIQIVRNLAASDPTVRNGLSCIGCHTEGMKDFEDEVRGVVKQNANPPFNKDRALSLYVDQLTMEGLVAEDTDRYRQALEKTGDIFGGIEPVQRFHEAFQRPLDAAHAAAAVGLQTEAFLKNIRENQSLKNLGLAVLTGVGGQVKRDTWTRDFSRVVAVLYSQQKIDPGTQEEVIRGEFVYIPDANLRAAIAEELGKTRNAPITYEEMAELGRLEADDKGISDLTGLEFATDLHQLNVGHNQNISDLSPIAGLLNLTGLSINDNSISDLSPLSELTNLSYINISHNQISDLSRLESLKNLDTFHSWGNFLSDLSPLVKLTEMNLRKIDICGGNPDISTLKRAKNLKELYLRDTKVSDQDISALGDLTNLTRLSVAENRNLSNLAPLAGLTNLEWLKLDTCNISDISALAGLTNLKWVSLEHNNISDFSPLDGLPETTTIIDLRNPGASIQPGPPIAGPWLWVITPIDTPKDWADWSGIDFLSEMSDGEATEVKIAMNGAVKDKPIGNSVWTAHEISPERNNINEMANLTGLGEGDIDFHIAYGSTSLISPQDQETHIFFRAGYGGKVYLNGELVAKTFRWFTAPDGYGTVVPVTLKQGTNFLFIIIYGDENAWTGSVAFKAGTAYLVSVNPRIEYSVSKPVIHTGDTFMLDLSVENIHGLAGWQFDIAFDPKVFKAIEVNEGDFLKTGGATTFFQKGRINNTTGRIRGLRSASLSKDGGSGTGVLLSVTFSAKTEGDTRIALQNVEFGSTTGEAIAAGPHETAIVVEGGRVPGDINRDGKVSILDIILVAQRFGENVPANTDVDMNGDGKVSILDLIIVAGHVGEATTAAAPSLLALYGIEKLNPETIQAWIERARIEDDGSIVFRQGIAYLESLLGLSVPEETLLLANYPNPFNPETWIPYQLSEPAEVTLRIYAVNGILVRTLALGQTPAGIYQSRSRAAYWDGKNDVGESVASGIYFYTLTAGDFTATRKMLIKK